MDQLKLFAALVILLCAGVILIGSGQDNPDQLTLEATEQQSRPPRGRGPFPGSPTPGHTAGLPIWLELLMPTGELRPNGTVAVDFVITNISTEPIKLPSSAVLFNSPMESLTLWLTSDGIKDPYLRDVGSGHLVKIDMVPISAELDGPSFYSLDPSKSIRVHASSPPLITGTHTFTAHAEFARTTKTIAPVATTTELIGTADSDAFTTTLSIHGPASR